LVTAPEALGMNDDNFNVLVVDDSSLELDLTTFFLREHFKVASAASGAEALALIANHKPAVVLLDVNMPDMNGYEVCRKIREHDKLMKIIFVSANDSTAEILNGYDAGGNDYVVKPFTPDILLSKVNQAIHRRKMLEQASQSAQGLAMEAMTSMGELGTVINFLKSSFRAANLDALANLLISFLGRFDLNVCIQLRTEFNQKNYATQSPLTPIEEELLSRTAKMSTRFAERGSRMFINYEHASLIVKNMPTDDDLKMGRLRDNLAIMIEAADEKLSLLALEEETQVALNYIQSVHEKIEAENSAFIVNTIHQIEFAFAALGMTEEQEENLIGLISKSQLEFENNFKDTRVIEKQIRSILQKIQSKSEVQTDTMSSDSIDFF
jgi:CheY-like chemotaxis protein